MFDSIELWGNDKDGNRQLIIELPSIDLIPTEPPEPPPEPDLIAGVVISNVPLRVRDKPTTIDSIIVGTFAPGDQAWFEDKVYAGSDGLNWLRVKKINGNDDIDARINGYVAKQYVDLNETDPIPPKVLTGDIQPVKIISPTGAASYRFQIGDQAWSHDPKLSVCTRSLAVSRQPIIQFYYTEGGYYINQHENEYWEMLEQANNTDQKNPVPFNAAVWAFYAVHESYMDSIDKQNKLIDLILQTLDDLEANNMLGMLVLKDDLRHFHNCPAEYPYHTIGQNKRLNEAYYREKIYNVQFMPFLHRLMARLGNRHCFIQVNNEPYVAQSEQAVLNYLEFVKAVRSVVRQYNTVAPFGLRIENSNVITWQGASNEQAVALFAPYVDFWQAHMYTDYYAIDIHQKWENQERVYDDLFRLAPQFNLPAILDECMIRHKNESTLVQNATTEQMKVRMLDMFDRGLYMAVWWGYCQGNRDTRLTDNRGFTNVLAYQGYYDLRELFYQLATNVLPTGYRWRVG